MMVIASEMNLALQTQVWILEETYQNLRKLYSADESKVAVAYPTQPLYSFDGSVVYDSPAQALKISNHFCRLVSTLSMNRKRSKSCDTWMIIQSGEIVSCRMFLDRYHPRVS